MALQLPVVQTGLEASIQAAMRNAGKGAVINLGTSGKQIASLSQPLGRITGQADQFTKSMEAANARVFAFGASVGIINNVAKAFKGIITSTIEVETSLANIYSVLDKAGSSAQDFESGLFEAAKNAGQSFKVAADAALELSRQGLNSQDVLKRLNDTLILTRLSGLDAAASVEGLSAAYNSFAGTGITTAEIVNKLVAVSQKYAVAEKDLIEGIKRAGSTAQQAGVSFDELAALITAVQEKTARGGAVIGNSFKTIFARLQDKTTLEYLSDLGIGVTDLEGKVLPATAILEGLAAKFNDFSKIGQADISEKLGGIYQLGNLLAALQDLSSEQSKYAGAIKVSAAAADQAYQKNAALNNTLESILNRVSVSAEQLGATLGSLGVTDNLKNILNFFTWLLDGIQKVLQEDSGIGKFFKGLVAGIGNLISGPGLALFGAIILKLSRDLVQFGFSSLKSFFGIGQAAKQIADVEKSVAQALSTNVSLQQRLLAVEGDRAAQLRIISAEIIAQEAMLRRIASTSAAIAPGLYGGGVRSTGQGLRVPKAADGYMPAVAEEASSVKRGVGGAKPSDKPVVIPNFNFGGGKRGTMVANSGEHIVPNFNGSGGSAIFNRDMVRKMGMPSGAQKISSAGGFVPNYSKKAVEKLVENKNIGQEGEKQYSKNYLIFKKGTDLENRIFNYLDLPPAGNRNLDFPQGVLSQSDVKRRQKLGITGSYGDLKYSTNQKNKTSLLGRLIEEFNLFDSLKNLTSGNKRPANIDLNSLNPNIGDAALFYKGNPQSSSKETITSTWAAIKDANQDKPNFLTKWNPIVNIGKTKVTKEKLKGAKISANILLDGVADPSDFPDIASAANGFIPNFAISQREAAYDAWDSPLKNGKTYDFVKRASTQSGTSPNKREAIEISKALDLHMAENSAQNRNNYKSNKQEDVTKRRADTSGAVAEFGMIYPSNSKGSVSSFLVGSQNEVVKGIPIIGKPSDDLYPEIEKGIINAGMNYAKNLGFNPDIIQEERFAAGIKSHLNPGTIEAAFGTVFESVFQSAMQVPPNNNQTLDLPNRSKLNSFVGSMERGGILKASIANNINPEMLAADFKNDLSDLNLSSMAAKIKAYRDKQATRGNTTKTSARGFIPNFAKPGGSQSSQTAINSINPDPKSPEYQRKQRLARAKKLKFESAAGTIGELFKVLPEKFFTDLVLGDSDYGVETPSIFKAIKDSALYSAAFAGPNALKFVQKSGEYGLDIARSLQYQLAKLVVKATTKKSSASGFLPNFADPIKDAVGREMSAGVPASQIYIDQNSSLKSAMNPNGLMVANRIDEPMGGSQGIARARKEGSNPMTYGAARGFVPNYADPNPALAPYAGMKRSEALTKAEEELTKSLEELDKEIDKSKKAQQKYTDGLSILTEKNQKGAPGQVYKDKISAQEQVTKGLEAKRTEATQQTAKVKADITTASTGMFGREKTISKDAGGEGKASSDKMLGTIFAVQGALSVLQGVLGEATGGVADFAKVATSVGSTIATTAFATQGLSAMGGMVGKVAGALGPFAIAGTALFTIFKEGGAVLDGYNGVASSAALALDKVSKAAEGAAVKLTDYSPAQQAEIQKTAKDLFDKAITKTTTQTFGVYGGIGVYGATGTYTKSTNTKASIDGWTDSLEKSMIQQIAFAKAAGISADVITNIYKEAAAENGISKEETIKASNQLADLMYATNNATAKAFENLNTTGVGASDFMGKPSEFADRLALAGTKSDPFAEYRKTMADSGMDIAAQNAAFEKQRVVTLSKDQAKAEQQTVSIQQISSDIFKSNLDTLLKTSALDKEAANLSATSNKQKLQAAQTLGNLSKQSIRDLERSVAVEEQTAAAAEERRSIIYEIAQKSSEIGVIQGGQETIQKILANLSDADLADKESALEIIKKITSQQSSSKILIDKQNASTDVQLEKIGIIADKKARNLNLDLNSKEALDKQKEAIDRIIESMTHLSQMKTFKIDLTATLNKNEIDKQLRDLENSQPQNEPARQAQSAAISSLKLSQTSAENQFELDKALIDYKERIVGAAKTAGISENELKNLNASLDTANTLPDIIDQGTIRKNLLSGDEQPYNNLLEKLPQEYQNLLARLAGNIAAATDEFNKNKLAPLIKDFSSYVIDLNNSLDAAIEQAKFEFLSVTSGSGLLDKASKDKFNAEMKSAGTSPSGISQAYANEAARSDQRRLALAGSAGDKTSIEYDIEINKKILAIKQENVDTQTLSEDQEARILELEKQRLEVNKSLSQKLKEAFATSPQDQINKLNNTLVEGAVKFRDTMIDGIVQAIETGKGLKDVLTSAVLDFSRELMRTSLKNLTGSLFGGIGGMFGQGKAMASGGAVSGGSGSKDDVPAMLMGGEYIINKKSVNKYGPKFLEAINSGNLNGYAKGGKVKDYFTPGTYGVKQMTTDDDLLAFATQEYTSGKKDKIRSGDGFASVSLEPESVRLTNFGRRNSPQAKRAKDVRKQIFGIYIDEMKKAAELKKQEEEEKKARKKAIKNALIMAAVSVAGSAITSGMSSGFKNAYSTSKLAGGTTATNMGAGFKGAFTGGGVSGLQGNNYGGLFNMFSKSGYVTKASQMAGSITSKGFIGPVQNSSNVNIGNNIAQSSFSLGGGSQTYPRGLFPRGLTPELEISSTDYHNPINLVGPHSPDVFDPNNPFFIDTGNTNKGYAGFAVGGSISETAGIDTIPTMLSGGEFVMNRAAAQNIGPGNLQAMNAGASKPMSEEASKDLNNKLLSKFDELIGTTEKSTGSITINVDGSSGKSSENSSGEAKGSNQQLSRQIRDAVLKVIQEEKRLGGQLRRGM